MAKARGIPTRLEQRLGWLLVVLATLVWPSALLHEATTLHAVCPEHGELLDVEAHDSTAHGDEAAGLRLVAPGGEDGGHELCPFVALGQPAAPSGEVPLRASRFPGSAALAEAGSEHRFQSIPILCLAPKQSPPL